MSKFKKKVKTQQEIPTAALPDIIFMLLFFFMVATELKEQTILVKQNLPKATQLQKLQDRTLVTHIYIGAPKDKRFGIKDKIQVNDVFVTPSDIPQFIEEERSKLPEADKKKLIVSLKADASAKAGIVNDVKLQLREADSRIVYYSSVGRSEDSTL